MADLLQDIDQRTKLVGENRLELLLFRLAGRQTFAVNVFKVQEVIKLPTVRPVPHSHRQVIGMTQWRGRAIPVIDLSGAIGMKALPKDLDTNLIVTEYNRSIQAFLIGPVDRIVNLNWEEVLPPPKGTGRGHFLTAITRVDERIVEVLDVERVLAEITQLDTRVSEAILDRALAEQAREQKLQVLLAEDSATAVKQVKETVNELGLGLVAVQDGLQALNQLKQWVSEGKAIQDQILMLITDAEMPEMDGYRLTLEIRQDASLRDLYVVLHTSLSGAFNQAMVDKVGCDAFLSKFAPDELATVIQARLRHYLATQAEEGAYN